MDTIQQVNDEIERVLGGGAPNQPIEISETLTENVFVFEYDMNGEYQVPSGEVSDFVVDENDLQPATPPEDSDVGVVMPTLESQDNFLTTT